MSEIIERKKATQKDGTTDKVEAIAVLGFAGKPEITISRALELF